MRRQVKTVYLNVNGGSYYPPSEIRVCPRGMDQAFIERTVKHEITHLRYEHEVQGMTHQEKEAYIEAKERQKDHPKQRGQISSA